MKELSPRVLNTLGSRASTRSICRSACVVNKVSTPAHVLLPAVPWPQVLCSEDPCFKNVVVWALASSKDELHLELPQRELTLSAAAEPLKADLLVPVTVKGRTSCELLVQPSCPGQAGGRLVAVHYKTLLKSASLDALLALADRIQVCMGLGCAPTLKV